MNNKYYAVCGIVEIGGKVLLVRHTYGTAKDRILLPGGYVHEDELPSAAAERELREETGVTAKAKAVFAAQFKPSQWCIVFTMDYVCGEPVSDGYENSEVLLLAAEDAVQRADITNMSREILRAYLRERENLLAKSDYLPQSADPAAYEIYGV